MSTPTLELRAFEVRKVNAADRTLTGLAVPYDTEIELTPGVRESIAPGAVEPWSGGVKLFAAHREPIGLVTEYRETPQGWEITARISQTPTGDEWLTLLRDGVVNRLSIGFDPVEHEEIINDADGSVLLRRTRLTVYEVSVVPFPAYDTAAVTSVRAHAREAAPTVSTTQPQPERSAMDTTETDLTEVRESIANLERRIDVGLNPAPVNDGPVFRSFGDYVKRLAAGDPIAARAYEGAVTGDAVLKDAWLGSLVQILHQKQVVAGAFSRGSLPAQGMGVEYAILKDDTTQVGVQAAEGDDLLFGKVSITTDRADVKTLGGWSSLTRQVIERSNVGILDTTFTALAEKYGRSVEIMARLAFTNALAATGDAALAEIVADLTTQDGIVSAVLDLVEKFDDTGRSLDGLFVDKATFKAIYGVQATDRVLQVNGAPLDKVGTITIQTGDANVAGLTFRLLPNAAANTVVAYDHAAIKTLEAAGAPMRLQDENIVNLSKSFSVYGYASSFLQVPAGLVKIVKAGTTTTTTTA